MKKIIYLVCLISSLFLVSCRKNSTAPPTTIKNNLTFKAKSDFGSLSIWRDGVQMEFSDIDDKAIYSKSFPDTPGYYEFIMTSVPPGYSWLEIYHNDTLVAREAISHSRRVNLKTYYEVK